MAGNSQRKGAMRNAGSKKGPTVGSGGQRRRALEGRGPTPKASERPGHPKARKAASAARRAEADQRGGGSRGGSRGGASRAPRKTGGDAPEVVAGRNAVVEALRAGVPTLALLVAARIDSDERVRESLKIAGNRGIPLLECSRAELDRASGGAVHQGLALQVPAYEYAHPDDLVARAHDQGETPLLVALDGVTDPRNLGAVVRSAAAFGAHGVLVPERRSAGMTAGAWKASAGAAARIPVARATNLARALEAYRAAGLFVVGLAAGGSAEIGALALADSPLVLVVGSEGQGLSRIVTAACDQVASIPMASSVESLNAGVAAGIALFSVAQARRA
jgi:23S rRNA (guanosine2251-2'-O)-methyltransferase